MKNNSISTRIFSLSMVLLLILTCFMGCKNDPPDVTENTSEDATADPTNGSVDKNGYKLDALPTMNFENDEVNILCWNSEQPEFETKYGDNVIENSIWERNTTVEERLGILLNFEETPGDVNNTGNYRDKVLNAWSSGDYWDIVAAHTRTTAICATQGLLKNLNGIDDSYLSFDEPWWSSSAIDATKVGNSFFICTGDISTNLVQMTYCLYFNAELVDSIGLESPYDLVNSNEWTLEALLTMISDTYVDQNNSETVDDGDRIGLVGAYYAWPALLHGCGVPLTAKNEAGNYVIHSDLKGDKADSLMTTFENIVELKDASINASISGFTSGNVLFFITESGAGMNKLSSVGFEYGCVPLPKYDAQQEQYYSTVRQPASFYGIMSNVPDERMGEVSATLECLASEGYRQTTPVIFDECMKYLRATSQEMSDMLELIRDTAWFDLARVYSYETRYLCDAPGYVLIDNESYGTTWAGYVNGKLSTVEERLSELNTTLQWLATQN